MQIKLNIFTIYRCLRHLFLRLLVFGWGLAGVYRFGYHACLLRYVLVVRHNNYRFVS